MICALVVVSVIALTVEILHEGVQLAISFQLWVQSYHAGGLILATAGVCTPWKSANTAGPLPLESQWLGMHQPASAPGSPAWV